MANLVLSECGIRPLPRIYTTPRSSFLSNNNNKPTTFKFRPSPSSNTSSSLGFRLNSRDGFSTRNWTLNVSTPLTVESSPIEEEHETQRFDPGAPPPFNLADIRAAIPKHCWVKNPWKSMSYVVRDVSIVFALAAGAAYLNNWLVWPLYWLAQGTMFWALFVLGHDCGHGSFSNDPRLNSVVGHLLHSSILVPYHGWRISHRTHHQNHGHVENDESWHPMSEKIYKSLDKPTRFFRFTLPLVMLAYPFYLWARSPGKKGSHYHPDSDLFLPKERKDVLTSTACWTAMAALLICLNFVMGPMQMLKLYGIPYWINVMWLDFVTYLHHHGHEDKLPWYRGKEWSYLRGGLTTLDRDYGLINNIHHDIGTHVIHHLFPQIPHYHLVEATEAAKPVLGKYYREPDKSGPLPLHLLGILAKSMKEDHYVSDQGDVVYYEADPNLYGEIKVINHGVRPELMEAAREVWRSFFNLPVEVKEVYSNSPSTYEGYEKGAILDWNDYYFLHFLYLNKWPSLPSNIRELMDEYGEELVKLGERLMRVLSSNLGLNEEQLQEAFGGEDVGACMRVSYCPKCPRPELALGLYCHPTPAASILLPDIQVRHGDTWITVNPQPHAFGVNLGDQMQVTLFFF